MTATPDTAASDRLILVEHSSAVLAYLERRSPNLPTALAHFRATMLHAWLKIDRLRSIDNRAQRVWLLNRAARTLAAAKSKSSDMHSTKTRFTRRRLAESTVASDSPKPLQAEMTRLPANQRELIALVHWDDLSVVEAGKVLGLGPAVARAQYAAGRANLKAPASKSRLSSRRLLWSSGAGEFTRSGRGWTHRARSDGALVRSQVVQPGDNEVAPEVMQTFASAAPAEF